MSKKTTKSATVTGKSAGYPAQLRIPPTLAKDVTEKARQQQEAQATFEKSLELMVGTVAEFNGLTPDVLRTKYDLNSLVDGFMLRPEPPPPAVEEDDESIDGDDGSASVPAMS